MLTAYSGRKILILDGASKQALPMIKGFHNNGCIVFVLCGSKLDAGYVYKYSDRKILKEIDHKNAEKTYAIVKSIIIEGRFDAVVPVTDFYAIMLSKNKEELKQYANIAVNDWDIFSLASDKLQTMKKCMEYEVPCPKTAIVDSIGDFTDSGFVYPLIVKPRSSWGSKGFHIANNYDELRQWYSEVSKTIGPVLIQEYIPLGSRQYQAEMVMDKYGNCKMFLLMEKLRQYPIDGGSSTLNVTIHNEQIKENCIRMMKLLGWRGYGLFDLIEDSRDGIVKVLEINARIISTVKICFGSGFDVSKAILQDILDETVDDCGDYQDGLRLRFFHKDILWFFRSPKRFSTKPSWFSNKNTIDMVFEWDDLRPAIAFSIESFKSLLKYHEHE